VADVEIEIEIEVGREGRERHGHDYDESVTGSVAGVCLGTHNEYSIQRRRAKNQAAFNRSIQ
jgi:hypothetical protein